jgi:hypothetical protein
MLAASPQLAYISEPLNVLHRPGILSTPVEHWYTYICPTNEDLYLPGLLETLAFRYHPLAEIKSLRSRKDIGRMIRDWSIFFRGRLLNQQPLLKDPFAVFSAPWFAERLNCRVVITLRHPAAFASSLKRLKWSFDFSHLLAQPLLMDGLLEPFQKEMAQTLAAPQDIIGQASLLWRIIYKVVARYQQAFPAFIVIRHEDLSLNPQAGFGQLYAQLELPFTPQVQAAIQGSSSAENPGELPKQTIHAVHLDSRANLENWKRRLQPAEIDRIRRLTQDLADHFYPDFDWE